MKRLTKKIVKITGLMVLLLVFAMTINPDISLADKKLNAPKVKDSIAYSGAVTLKWEKVSGTDGYVIYKYNTSEKKYVKIKNVSASKNECDIMGLKSQTTYKFKIAAYKKDSGHTVIQKKSGTVTVKTLKRPKNAIKDFTVYIGKTKYKITDFIGRPVIINYWATWCGPCVGELPYFNSAYQKYKDKVRFFMINRESEVSSFIKKNKYKFPVYYDYDEAFQLAYGTDAIPQTIVINANGEIEYNETGALDESSLDVIMDYIISE